MADLVQLMFEILTPDIQTSSDFRHFLYVEVKVSMIVCLSFKAVLQYLQMHQFIGSENWEKNMWYLCIKKYQVIEWLGLYYDKYQGDGVHPLFLYR